jgi:hypothetical protein
MKPVQRPRPTQGCRAYNDDDDDDGGGGGEQEEEEASTYSTEKSFFGYS